MLQQFQHKTVTKKRPASSMSKPTKAMSMEWLQQSGMWFQNKDASMTATSTTSGVELPKFLTHTIPFYGVLKVPERLWGSFLKACAYDLKEGNDIYYYERMLTVHRFVLDFDFDTVVSSEEWTKYVITIQAVMKLFYTTNWEQVVIAVVCKSDKTSSTGLHVRFPYCIVDLNTCQLLYTMILKTLIDVHGERKGKPWSQIVDRSIFKGQLRMLGAKKIVPCPCRKKKLDAAVKSKMDDEIVCETIPCTGQSHPPYRYDIEVILNPKGQPMDELLNSIKNDWIKKLTLTTIQVPLTESLTPYSVPSDCPKALSPAQSPDKDEKQLTLHGSLSSSSSSSSSVKRRKIETVPDVTDEKSKSIRFKETDIDMNSDLGKSIRNAVSSFHPQYKYLEITRILKSQSDYYLINVTGIGSHYCLNKGSTHNSSTIYFIFHRPKHSPPYIAQRCHCPKEYNGINCKKFVSEGRQLAASVSKKLFVRTTKSLKIAPATVDELIRSSDLYLLSSSMLSIDQTNKTLGGGPSTATTDERTSSKTKSSRSNPSSRSNKKQARSDEYGEEE